MLLSLGYSLTLIASLVLAGDDAWHLDRIYTLVNEAVDPIIAPNAVSSHMHKVIGGSRFGASYGYEDYAAAKCSSLQCQADKSNYWMPQLYWKDSKTNNYIPLPAAIRFYYFLGRNSPSETVEPFPKGLQMIVGDPNRKNLTDGLDKPQFTCQTSKTGRLGGPSFNFDRECPNGMKTEIFFPPCWDGINLKSADQSHMSYPLNGNTRDGQCPITHPVRLPAILLEYTWHTSQAAPGQKLAGNLMWANGDTTGYGIHGDFVNGWDVDVLRTALNSPACGIGKGESLTMSDCPVLNAYFDDAKASSCKPEKGVLEEANGNADLITIKQVPGCNLPWGATGSKPTCDAAARPATNLAAIKGTVGSIIAEAPVNFKLPAEPGWHNLGCLNGDEALVKAVNYIDPKMTPESCQASCHRGNYRYAALGHRGSSQDCICTNELDSTNAGIMPGSCNIPCASDKTKMCGGNYFYDVYYAPDGTAVTSNLAAVPSYAGSRYTGCYSDRKALSEYNFYSGSMTNQVCITACAQRSYSWALTYNNKNCACGNTLARAGATYVPESFCASPCGGNRSEVCGDVTRGSVFSLHTSDDSPATVPVVTGSTASSKSVPASTATKTSSTARPTLTNENALAITGTVASSSKASSSAKSGSTVKPSSTSKASDAPKVTFITGPPSFSDDGDETTTSSTPAPSTSASSPNPSEGAVGYLGCFARSAQLSPQINMTGSALTPQSCQAWCLASGFRHAGVISNNACGCFSTIPESAAHDTSCTIPCIGHTDIKCGGSSAYAIYTSESEKKRSGPTVRHSLLKKRRLFAW